VVLFPFGVYAEKIGWDLGFRREEGDGGDDIPDKEHC
jgi:hypothetical protein